MLLKTAWARCWGGPNETGTVLVCMPGVRVGCVQTVSDERRERCNTAGEASAAGKSRAEKGREKRAWGE